MKLPSLPIDFHNDFHKPQAYLFKKKADIAEVEEEFHDTQYLSGFLQNMDQKYTQFQKDNHITIQHEAIFFQKEDLKKCNGSYKIT